jgi:hypothetical protein
VKRIMILALVSTALLGSCASDPGPPPTPDRFIAMRVAQMGVARVAPLAAHASLSSVAGERGWQPAGAADATVTLAQRVSTGARFTRMVDGDAMDVTVAMARPRL